MGISRESLGQIRDILRKLDHSIDSAREKRLSENERRHGEHSEDLLDPAERAHCDEINELDRRIG